MTMRTFIELNDQGVVVARIITSSELTPEPPLFEVTAEIADDVSVGQKATPEVQRMAESIALKESA